PAAGNPSMLGAMRSCIPCTSCPVSSEAETSDSYERGNIQGRPHPTSVLGREGKHTVNFAMEEKPHADARRGSLLTPRHPPDRQTLSFASLIASHPCRHVRPFPLQWTKRQWTAPLTLHLREQCVCRDAWRIPRYMGSADSVTRSIAL